MCASLETLVIAAYVFADSLSIPRPGPSGKVTDQELIALAVAQAVTGQCSDRQFLSTIGRLLPGFFPHLPDQSQYNRRLRRLTPYITRSSSGSPSWSRAGASGLSMARCWAAPTTPAVARRARSPATRPTATARPRASGTGGCGCCSSPTAPARSVGYDLKPANENEREGVFELASAHPDTVLFADAGHRGREHHDSLALAGVEPIVPDEHKLGQRPAAEIDKAAFGS